MPRARLACADGSVLCKLFCRGVPHDPALCGRSHAPRSSRCPCSAFAVAGRCPRGKACWLPHVLANAEHAGPALVLCAPAAVLPRVRVAVHEAGFRPSETTTRGAEARGCEHALLVRPPAGGDTGDASSLRDAAVKTLLLSLPYVCAALSRALWVTQRSDSVLAAAAAAAAALSVSNPPGGAVVRLRAFPPWTAAPAAEALSAAGVRVLHGDDGEPSAASATHTLDLLLAAGCAHWDLRAADVCSALLSLRGRQPYAGPCRAYLKLDELFHTSSLSAASSAVSPSIRVALRPGDVAIDVGASPGGWTLRLSEALDAAESEAHTGPPSVEALLPKGHVYAIDPGASAL